MTSSQPEFDFTSRKPKVSGDDLATVEAALHGRGWIFAKTLKSELGIPTRKLRAIAEESDGLIISGQKGYRLLDGSATLDDVNHAAGWLTSQAARMAKRSKAIWRRYHQCNVGTGRN